MNGDVIYIIFIKTSNGMKKRENASNIQRLDRIFTAL